MKSHADLKDYVMLNGWATPNTVDAKLGTRIGPGQVQLCGRKVNMGLASQVHLGFLNVGPARLTATGEMLLALLPGWEMAAGGTRHYRAGSWVSQSSGTFARLW